MVFINAALSSEPRSMQRYVRHSFHDKPNYFRMISIPTVKCNQWLDGSLICRPIDAFLLSPYRSWICWLVLLLAYAVHSFYSIPIHLKDGQRKMDISMTVSNRSLDPSPCSIHGKRHSSQCTENRKYPTTEQVLNRWCIKEASCIAIVAYILFIGK